MSVTETIRCAATIVNQSGSRSPCQNAGTSTCGKCNLVIYCGREHQSSDWPNHKVFCKDPAGSVDWEPGYIVQKRTPSFVQNRTPFISHGGSHYVWGSPPALDFLKLEQNEGLDAPTTNMDLSVCFAASGDIRNLVETVNHLPSDHKGVCRFLINDHDPFIFNRNLGILLLLLKDDIPIEEASEAAVHLMYSVGLTPKIAQWWRDTMREIAMAHFVSDPPLPQSTHRTRGAGTVEIHAPPHAVAVIFKATSTSYDLTQAKSAMHQVMRSPSRLDYFERRLAYLTPSHRLGFKWRQENGMLLPFGSGFEAFTEPNRTLFNLEVEWLSNDNADPLEGWPTAAVLSSGAQYGVPKKDWYGSLSYHVKAQFIEFARRVRDMNITIYVTAYNARDLAKMIATDRLFPLFKDGFDRIDTSNVADPHYLGIPAVVEDWGQLLQQSNPHATLSLQFINWITRQENSSPSLNNREDAASIQAFKKSVAFFGTSRETILRGRNHPTYQLWNFNIDLFYDNGPAFDKYLEKQGLNRLAKRVGLVRKLKHSIIPKRKGLPLDQQDLVLPPVTKATFYNLGCVEGGTWSDRTVELKVIKPKVKTTG